MLEDLARGGNLLPRALHSPGGLVLVRLLELLRAHVVEWEQVKREHARVVRVDAEYDLQQQEQDPKVPTHRVLVVVEYPAPAELVRHLLLRRHHHRVVGPGPIRDGDRSERPARHGRVRRRVHRLDAELVEQRVRQHRVRLHHLHVEPFHRARTRRSIGGGPLRRTRHVASDLADEPRELRDTRRAGEFGHGLIPRGPLLERERELVRVRQDLRGDCRGGASEPRVTCVGVRNPKP